MSAKQFWIDKEALIMSQKLVVTFVAKEEMENSFPVIEAAAYEKAVETLIKVLKSECVQAYGVGFSKDIDDALKLIEEWRK